MPIFRVLKPLAIAAVLSISLSACAALSPPPIWSFIEMTAEGTCVKDVEFSFGQLRHLRGHVRANPRYCSIGNSSSTFQEPLPTGRLKARWVSDSGVVNVADVDMEPILKAHPLDGGKLRVVYGPTFLEVWIHERNVKRVGALPSGALPAGMFWLPVMALRVDTATKDAK
jgi:hypothetical protein